MFENWTHDFKEGAENLAIGTGIVVFGGLAMAAAVSAIGFPLIPDFLGPMEATRSGAASLMTG
ncbi:MAG: hypothetical protein Q8P68_03955 [Candidatus Peregrinibacteria bacterium]|nr:hypothetical protein [Candidatus Peregrinibacteria bacterium]MDZ4245311.1 hypothetical protein [Candidatus Gracilibacteria bacterium]